MWLWGALHTHPKSKRKMDQFTFIDILTILVIFGLVSLELVWNPKGNGTKFNREDRWSATQIQMLKTLRYKKKMASCTEIRVMLFSEKAELVPMSLVIFILTLPSAPAQPLPGPSRHGGKLFGLIPLHTGISASTRHQWQRAEHHGCRAAAGLHDHGMLRPRVRVSVAGAPGLRCEDFSLQPPSLNVIHNEFAKVPRQGM